MLMPSIFGESLLDDFMRDPFSAFVPERKAPYGKQAPQIMKTDVRETEGSFELDIDLPGFKKDEVQAELENGYLTISTNKSVEKDDEKEGQYIRRERYTGTMKRSFYVGDSVKREDIKAKFEDGILKLSIPKPENKPKIEENKFIAIE